MKTREEIFEILKSQFPDAVTGIDATLPTEPIITVIPSMMKEIAVFLRENEELQFDSLMLLSGVDDANGTKTKNEDGHDVITGGTLSVYYHLDSVYLKHKVTLRVSVPREKPEIESVSYVWRTSDWHEREAYDLFGFIFLNHPNLERILMPYDWEGYPLRKDYVSPEFYQGMKIPY
jgi:NADH-quinone oxidoreductase subunit C